LHFPSAEQPEANVAALDRLDVAAFDIWAASSHE
jgi:hypothetical protein